jgi:glycosyltransferase involved in cell wall biosynthesis
MPASPEMRRRAQPRTRSEKRVEVPASVDTADVRAAAGGRARRRMLMVVNNDWFFLSHRLPLARAARDAGIDVTIVAHDNGHSETIRGEGFGFIALPIQRTGIGAVAEARTFLFLLRLYRRLRPDLVHHVTIRPVLYGSLAARLVRSVSVVNAISGLGYVFSEKGRAEHLRRLVETLYRIALRGERCHTIFQNPDDRDEFVRCRLVDVERTLLIRGSGVDCAQFAFSPEQGGSRVVLLPARLLWDKGVGTFVEAARRLSSLGVDARFVLAGEPDEGNPTAVPLKTLRQWIAEGIVEWWGHQDDMPAVLSQTSVVVLPTRREGLPKALLEAGAVGRAVVATDVPGCREVVRHEINGLLVPPDDPDALASAIRRLLEDPELRREFGAEGRRIVEAEFTQEIVAARTLELYERLLWNGREERRFAPSS